MGLKQSNYCFLNNERPKGGGPELLGERHKWRGGWGGGVGRTPLHTMTTLGTWPGLATQPHYEAPCELWVKHRQNTVINIE